MKQSINKLTSIIFVYYKVTNCAMYFNISFSLFAMHVQLYCNQSCLFHSTFTLSFKCHLYVFES